MSDRLELFEAFQASDQRGLSVTARLSDMFEANGLSIDAVVVSQGTAGRCRAVGVDNESDQVP